MDAVICSEKVLAESVTSVIRRVKRSGMKKDLWVMRFRWTVRGGDDKL